MKKRLLSTLLALYTILTLLPASAMALEPYPETAQEDMPLLLPEADGAAPEFMPEEASQEAEPDFPDYDSPAEIPDVEADVAANGDIPEFVPGVVPDEVKLVYPNYDILDGATLAAKYDGRTYQTSVKNQGVNGVCWAFGTYAALEANALKNGLKALDFSELHMAYATSNYNGNTAQGWDRRPQDGGNRLYSSSYLMRGTSLSGTVAESADPYANYVTSYIPDTRALSTTQSKAKNYIAQNVLYLTGDNKATSAEVKAIKSAVQQYGGVGASIYWDGQTTASNGALTQKYYNSNNAAYYFPEKKTMLWGGETILETNHLVEIAGWDDNYSTTNFNSGNRPKSNGAWLVKNSWGSNWGDGGYVWVSYEDTNFPINAFCFDGIKAYTSDTTIYETDYKYNGYYPNSSAEYYYAKVFTVNKANEILQSVRVFTTTPCSIEVDYITNFNFSSSSWTGYTFSAKGSSNSGYPGWYTIDLKTPATLGAVGSKFAVVVKLKGSQGVYMGADLENGIANAKSYSSSSGSYWTNTDGNYCIKAITSTKLATPKLSSVTANSPTSVTIKWGKVSGAAQYRVFYKTGSGSWTKAADTTSTSYTWTNAKAGTKYTFTVRCLSADGKSFTSSYNSTGMSVTTPKNSTLATPKLSSATANSPTSVTIKWGAVSGAAQYRVFYKIGTGSWRTVADTASTSYTWKNAAAGTKYIFTVRCLSADGKSYTSSFDSTGKSVTTPA